VARAASLAITQGLLAVAAGFLIFGSMMGKLASGTYVALGALSILLGDALYDLWTIIRTRRATVPAG
jgi:hypothetical protein